MTFILHDHLNNMALLSLLFDISSSQINEDMLIDNKARLQLLLINIHEKMHQLTTTFHPVKRADNTKKIYFPSAKAR
ncbi:LuxR family transcriptional regulator, quorum-sensing system regulator ExpR [Izhakiella capsodis]|uniref:LuxR family transcriptional regulator, quorum-sensing system regulator ExpR n=2 Tax=Izhakiella capsodis TaxID=1367852 RepID=A0A1I4VRM3_9GAMM|nr:LuxR family transcriptional regulator, quorum-sensing system regulator ExpR [Izhakiella capsodis]